MKSEMETRPLHYLLENLGVALGLVLIWRSMWYGLDALDMWLFEGSHTITVALGLFIGLLILYIPHRNLKALERL
jgi:hypothetical protein